MPTETGKAELLKSGQPYLKFVMPEDVVFLKEGEEENKGYLKAVIATTGVIDRHGDRLVKGSIGSQDVVLSAYGHATIKSGELPIGRGKVYEEGDKVYFEGRFFMDIQKSAETYDVIKRVADLQEYSFSLHDIDYRIVKESSKSIFEITKTTVKETSPVLRGAGIGTGTVIVKDNENTEDMESENKTLKEQNETLKAENESLKAENTDLKAAVNVAADTILSPYGGSEDADSD